MNRYDILVSLKFQISMKWIFFPAHFIFCISVFFQQGKGMIYKQKSVPALTGIIHANVDLSVFASVG